MLYDPLCNWIDSVDLPTTSATGAVEEGVGLVYSINNGVTQVAIGPGSDTSDLFAGIAISRRVQPTTAIKYESLVTGATTVSSCYVITISRTPVNPTTDMSFYSSTGSATPGTIANTYESSTGAVAANNEYYITGTTVSLYNSTVWGPTVTVNAVYRYTLYAYEAIQLAGQQVPLSATAQLNSVGVVQRGTVWTDKFQPHDNWGTFNAGSAITLGANGIFTLASGGAAVKASVVGIPSANIPYLGLHIDAY